MPTRTLTDRFVAHARAKTRTTYFDTKARGLALRLTPNGAKSWAFVYRVNGSPSRWLALGTYDAMTLAEARTVARTHRHTVDVDGRDPIVERATAAAAEEAAVEHEAAEREAAVAPVFTFADFLKLYATIAPSKKKTWQADLSKARKYLLPAWGTLPLRDLKRTHVHELLDNVVGQGLTIGVNRLQALISRLFTIALDRSLIDAHPATRMEKRFKEQASERVLSDDELKALWTGLDAHPGAAADVVRLRLLLGQRGGEIADMTWGELDADLEVWLIPGKRTKNSRPHAVPLPPTVAQLLARRLAAGAADESRVFPGFTLAHDDHRGLAVLHGGAYEWKDLRRTVATRLAGLGCDETTIGRVLNHARYSVTAKHYNQHAYLEEKRAALDAWDRELAAILSGDRATRKVLRHRPRPSAS